MFNKATTTDGDVHRRGGDALSILRNWLFAVYRHAVVTYWRLNYNLLADTLFIINYGLIIFNILFLVL